MVGLRFAELALATFLTLVVTSLVTEQIRTPPTAFLLPRFSAQEELLAQSVCPPVVCPAPTHMVMCPGFIIDITWSEPAGPCQPCLPKYSMKPCGNGSSASNGNGSSVAGIACNPVAPPAVAQKFSLPGFFSSLLRAMVPGDSSSSSPPASSSVPASSSPFSSSSSSASHGPCPNEYSVCCEGTLLRCTFNALCSATCAPAGACNVPTSSSSAPNELCCYNENMACSSVAGGTCAQQTGSPRTVLNCSECIPTAYVSCCFSGGSCFDDLDEEACWSWGGVPLGGNNLCATGACSAAQSSSGQNSSNNCPGAGCPDDILCCTPPTYNCGIFPRALCLSGGGYGVSNCAGCRGGSSSQSSDPTGSCCQGSFCWGESVTQNQCSVHTGATFVAGQDCFACMQQAQLGACCSATDNACIGDGMSSTDCMLGTNWGGFFYMGYSCARAGCVSPQSSSSSIFSEPPTELCCFADGLTCSAVPEGTCAGQTGNPRTVSNCSECLPVINVSCCFPDGSCFDDVPEETCQLWWGTSLGGNALCSASACGTTESSSAGNQSSSETGQTSSQLATSSAGVQTSSALNQSSSEAGLSSSAQGQSSAQSEAFSSAQAASSSVSAGTVSSAPAQSSSAEDQSSSQAAQQSSTQEESSSEGQQSSAPLASSSSSSSEETGICCNSFGGMCTSFGYFWCTVFFGDYIENGTCNDCQTSSGSSSSAGESSSAEEQSSSLGASSSAGEESSSIAGGSSSTGASSSTAEGSSSSAQASSMGASSSEESGKACCMSNGDCFVLPPGQCRQQNGNPMTSKTCSPTTCPPPQSSSSAEQGSSSTQEQSSSAETQSSSAGAASSAAQTSSVGASSSEEGSKACCFSNGDCFDLTPGHCRQVNGSPMNNITCTPNPCPVPPASSSAGNGVSSIGTQIQSSSAAAQSSAASSSSEEKGNCCVEGDTFGLCFAQIPRSNCENDLIGGIFLSHYPCVQYPTTGYNCGPTGGSSSAQTSSGESSSEGACGNTVVQTPLGEQCDEGTGNSAAPNATCRLDCKTARCGDAIVDDNPSGRDKEFCDDGDDCSNGHVCNSDTAPARCRTDCKFRNTFYTIGEWLTDLELYSINGTPIPDAPVLAPDTPLLTIGVLVFLLF